MSQIHFATLLLIAISIAIFEGYWAFRTISTLPFVQKTSNILASGALFGAGATVFFVGFLVIANKGQSADNITLSIGYFVFVFVMNIVGGLVGQSATMERIRLQKRFVEARRDFLSLREKQIESPDS